MSSPKKKAPAKKAPAQKAPAKKAPAKKAPAKQAVDETPYAAARAAVSDSCIAAIRDIADECTTVEEFMDRAYSEIDGIDGDTDIQLLVDDTESAESIWAEAVAAAE